MTIFYEKLCNNFALKFIGKNHSKEKMVFGIFNVFLDSCFLNKLFFTFGCQYKEGIIYKFSDRKISKVDGRFFQPGAPEDIPQSNSGGVMRAQNRTDKFLRLRRELELFDVVSHVTSVDKFPLAAE